MIRFRTALLLVLLLSLGLGPALALENFNPKPFDNGRNKLLSYMLREQLVQNHFSQKKFNDEFSLVAFDLYLKQLDFQKRFLLEEDVKRLKSYDDRIDDELNRTRVLLPAVGMRILESRIEQVRAMAEEILAGEFDFTRDEKMESDPEKLEFCRTEDELRERWRKILKFQVLTRYLNLLDDEGLGDKESLSDDEALRAAELKTEAMEKVRKRQDEFFSRMSQETEQDHYDRYFNAVTRAFDPHTNYLPPRKKEDFDISMRGSLEGIGATLREEDGYIKVVEIIPGSAAARQGQLEAEDIILAVAEGANEPVDITDTRIRDAVSLIRGKKGTEVRLTVRKPEGTRIVLPIIRDVVQIEESFVKSTVLDDEDSGRTYGYVKIPAFYRDFEKTRTGHAGRNSTDDVKQALEELNEEKISGLILDLRNNGGGSLSDAVSITGLFIETGPVVQIRNEEGKIKVLADRDPEIQYDGPMVVLVNQFSASASEILAGALQDYDRAIVIGGEHTHGKGTVQAMLDLDRNNPLPNMEKYAPLGALKITIQKFYRVSGGSTQYRGVEPDIVLPNRLQHLETGEQYLDYSLPWDTVGPVEFDKWNALPENLEAIREKSRQRAAQDEALVEISEMAQKAKERIDQTLQPLNIDEFRREREEGRSVREDMADIAGAENHEGGPASEKEEPTLQETISEDPYAREAVAILGDLIAGPSAVAGGGPGHR